MVGNEGRLRTPLGTPGLLGRSRLEVVALPVDQPARSRYALPRDGPQFVEQRLPEEVEHQGTKALAIRIEDRCAGTNHRLPRYLDHPVFLVEIEGTEHDRPPLCRPRVDEVIAVALGLQLRDWDDLEAVRGGIDPNDLLAQPVQQADLTVLSIHLGEVQVLLQQLVTVVPGGQEGMQGLLLSQVPGVIANIAKLPPHDVGLDLDSGEAPQLIEMKLRDPLTLVDHEHGNQKQNASRKKIDETPSNDLGDQ